MRILLAANRTQVGPTIKWLLTHDPEICIVGEVTEAHDLLTQAQQSQPDLILLDCELPGLQMADLLHSLRALCDHAKVVAYSERTETYQEALTAGVKAFVSKTEPPGQLVSTLRAAGGLSPYYVG
jgi:DNA-binding NarL/FixJ family response regulator